MIVIVVDTLLILQMITAIYCSPSRYCGDFGFCTNIRSICFVVWMTCRPTVPYRLASESLHPAQAVLLLVCTLTVDDRWTQTIEIESEMNECRTIIPRRWWFFSFCQNCFRLLQKKKACTSSCLAGTILDRYLNIVEYVRHLSVGLRKVFVATCLHNIMISYKHVWPGCILTSMLQMTHDRSARRSFLVYVCVKLKKRQTNDGRSSLSFDVTHISFCL